MGMQRRCGGGTPFSSCRREGEGEWDGRGESERERYRRVGPGNYGFNGRQIKADQVKEGKYGDDQIWQDK